MAICTDCSFSVVVTLHVNVINWIQGFLAFFTVVFFFLSVIRLLSELQNVDAITILTILNYQPSCCNML